MDRALVDAVLEDRRVAVPRRPGRGAGGTPRPQAPTTRRRNGSCAGSCRRILREADPRRRRQRAYALLARSGFSPDVCSAVSRRVLDGETAPADEAADEVADPDPDGD